MHKDLHGKIQNDVSKEQERDREAKRAAREDEDRRQQEQERDREAKRDAWEDEDRRQQEQQRDREARRRVRGIQQQLLPQDRQPAVQAPPQSLPDIRAELLEHLSTNYFDFNLFDGNPLLAAGRLMYHDLEKVSWETCINCHEHYICMPVGIRSHKCQRCQTKPALFCDDNDLNPTPAPACLQRLSPIEKSVIYIICPTIAIYKMGSSSFYLSGHTISFYQDITDLASTLPRLPMDLPFIPIKSPNEQLTDKMFQVNRARIIEALQYLKAHNEDYAHIAISDANTNLYPEQGCIQNIPQVDPASLRLTQEQPTHTSEDSVCEQASTVDLPGPMHSVLECIQLAI